MPKPRLRAYYYGFNETAVPEVDLILSAVACAGKAFHLTEDWNEQCDYTPEGHTGTTPADCIQNAANLAAEDIARLRTINAELVAALSVLVEHHDYSYLDRGVGTATDSGKAWIKAHKLLAKAKGGKL